MTTRLIHPACTVATLLICSRAAIAAPPSRGHPAMPPAAAATAAQRHIAATVTPNPSLVSRQVVRQRVQFLNLLIRREDLVIRDQKSLIQQASRISSVLDRRRILVRLERNSSNLIAGLNRENLVLKQLAQMAPTSPEVRRSQLLIDRQTQQVASFIRPPATPIR